MKTKSEYLKEPSNGALYVITEHWDSDMQFYSDEIHFLKHLIHDHFLWIIEAQHLQKVNDLHHELHVLSGKATMLKNKVEKHLSHLAELDENEFAYDEQEFRDEHLGLEKEVAEFCKDFRVLKRQIFETVKGGIDHEKLKYLQDGQAS